MTYAGFSSFILGAEDVTLMKGYDVVFKLAARVFDILTRILSRCALCIVRTPSVRAFPSNHSLPIDYITARIVKTGNPLHDICTIAASANEQLLCLVVY